MRRTTLDFDELNELDSVRQLEKQVKGTSKKRGGSIFIAAIPYDEYFGKMYISPEEMNTRIDLAKQIEDVMLWVFAYWIIAKDADIPIDEVKQDARDKLISVIARHTKLDPYLEEHINKVIDEVVDVTARRADSDAYWTSQDRAMLIAEDEANAFENYNKYREAKAQGKTKKVWLTELDDKVRLSHELSEGQTVDIDGLFLVGGSQMRFPKDTMYDPAPEEIINCRCVCEYK